jgi:hypothetical protein
VFEPQVVPGLLQTTEYAAAMIAGNLPEATPEQVEKRVNVRIRRQERITDPDSPLRMWAVIDEAALCRKVGSAEIMREQLMRLVELSHLPHVTVQVLPFEAGAHPGLSGQFAVLEFTDTTDATVVYLEGVNSDLYLEKDTDVQAYSVMYEHLRAQALSAEQTRVFITEAAERYV